MVVVGFFVVVVVARVVVTVVFTVVFTVVGAWVVTVVDFLVVAAVVCLVVAFVVGVAVVALVVTRVVAFAVIFLVVTFVDGLVGFAVVAFGFVVVTVDPVLDLSVEVVTPFSVVDAVAVSVEAASSVVAVDEVVVVIGATVVVVVIAVSSVEVFGAHPVISINIITTAIHIAVLRIVLLLFCFVSLTLLYTRLLIWHTTFKSVEGDFAIIVG